MFSVEISLALVMQEHVKDIGLRGKGGFKDQKMTSMIGVIN